MATVICPHCEASNPDAGDFCIQCGQAIPRRGDTNPLLFRKSDTASSAVGQAIQSEALKKKMKSARGALLAVAILQCVTGALVYFLLSQSNDPAVQSAVAVTVTIVLVIGAVYFGLWHWAKTSPFPAAVVGLVTYVTLLLAGAAFDPSTLLQGILIKAIIIAILIKAVSAGAQHRKLIPSA